MLHPSTKKLIDRLVEMTALGKIDWKEGESDTVVYTTEGYSVSLESEPNEIVITASDGRELERGTAEELAEATDADGTSYTARVAEMTREATRKAKGIDKAITTLLAGIDLDGDGIPDIPAEEVNEPEVETVEAEALEDAVDDSAAVSVEEVEQFDDEAESSEDAVDAADSDEEVFAVTEEPQAGEAGSPEEDMTVAVARLADEVNGRDAQPIEASADDVEASASDEDAVSDMSEVGLMAGLGATAVGLAAAVSTEDDEIEAETASEEVSAEPNEVFEAVEAVAVEEIATEDFAPEEALEEVVSEVAAAEDVSETVPETTLMEVESFVDETVGGAVPEITAEDFDADTSLDVGTELASVEPSEPISVLSDEVTQDASDVESAQVQITEDPIHTPLTDQAETLAETLESEPTTFDGGISLSGISAGFGLGALQAKGEASGVPSATFADVEQDEPEAVDAASEKIVIDATDEVSLTDVPEQVPEASELPDVASMAAVESVKAEETETETVDEALDEVSLTLKTRFNPWT